MRSECSRQAVPPGGRNYAEMVRPDDCSRRFFSGVFEGGCPPDGAIWIRYGLFGHDLEKGVVLRGRIRGIWADSRSADQEARRRYEAFLSEPPALGP